MAGRIGALQAVFVTVAFCNNGGVEAAAKIVGKFVEFRVAVYFNRALSGVAYDVAVMTPLQMFLKLGLGPGVHGVVEVISQLFQKVRAFHGRVSPSRRLKYLLRRSRNCKRARSNLDFTAGTLNSSADAVSSVESPSTSRSTKTVRKLGGKP